MLNMEVKKLFKRLKIIRYLGVTAFPGDGGKIFGLRNKRLYREFQPKKEWFDFEDMNFDYEPIDKDMPWDPEIARKMDRYTYKKFFTKNIKK